MHCTFARVFLFSVFEKNRMNRLLLLLLASTFFWQAACNHRQDVLNKSRFTKKQEYYKGAENTPRTDPKDQYTFMPEATVYFDFNSSSLNYDGMKTLDLFFSNEVSKNPYEAYFVEGNTDSVGSEDYNLVLSEKRANAVIAYLISMGSSASQFSILARGELNPIADNTLNPELNRRVIIYRKTKN